MHCENKQLNAHYHHNDYRSPTGDFSYFLNSLESTLNIIYNNTTNIIICGDFNINYLHETNNKQLLNSLVASYSLHSAVQFPTRIQDNFHNLIENIFINTFKHDEFSVYPQ